MTVSSWTVSNTTSTDAAFRAWGSAIGVALAALGFVQTADTGQINWTTVTKPVSINTAQGYEVWRFADALQASAPIFFKIEYGCPTNTNLPGLWLTVGTGSDGAGTITGSNIANVSFTPTRLTGAAAASGAAVPSYLVTDAAQSAMLLADHVSVPGGHIYLLIERTRDFTGAPNGDGVFVLIAGSSTHALGYLSYLPFATGNPGTIPTSTAALLSPATPAVNTCVVNNVVYPVPIATGIGPRSIGFSKFLAVVCAGDLAGGATFTMSLYSESNTWLADGSSIGNLGNSVSNLNALVARIT